MILAAAVLEISCE